MRMAALSTHPSRPETAVAAPPPEEERAQGAPSAQLSENRVLGQLLALARDIRNPRRRIGYSAFVCWALARHCRPFVWEGEKRIDLIQVYAPWAEERCTKLCVVDAVCSCLAPAVAGERAHVRPVSDEHPLHCCNHFIAAVPMEEVLPGPAHTIEGFYSILGIALLGTVVDGDCGIDVLRQMEGLPQSRGQRRLTREERHVHVITRL